MVPVGGWWAKLYSKLGCFPSFPRCRGVCILRIRYIDYLTYYTRQGEDIDSSRLPGLPTIERKVGGAWALQTSMFALIDRGCIQQVSCKPLVLASWSSKELWSSFRPLWPGY